jgi:hypothetical protein
MSEAEYERQRAELRATYGDNAKEANSKREQAFAKFFYCSGWTQEQLAKKEGQSPSRVAQRLKFGAFLAFLENSTMVEKSANPVFKTLSERKFREYWDRVGKTETNDRARFLEVARLMEEETTLSRSHANKRIGHLIVDKFADAKWHAIETIANKVVASQEDVEATLDLMREKGTYRSKCERRTAGKTFQYRIFRQTRTISSDELITKLTPLIEGLITEGKKHPATVSISAVARFAALLKRQLDEWTE